MAIDSVLLVEPDPAAAQSWAQMLRTHQLRVTVAPNGPAAQSELSHRPVDWILLSDQAGDVSLPDLLTAGPRRLWGTPVLFLARTEASAAAGLQRGATDYLLTPFEVSQLELALTKAAAGRRRLASFSWASRQRSSPPLDLQWTGPSSAMERLRQSIRKLALTDAALLLQGESGSGKSLVAREIHRHSPRALAPLILIDCGHLDPHQLSCLLFGEDGLDHEGRRRRQLGGWDAAHDGTLVLEDVGLAPEPVQRALLQYLQHRSFRRVGGKEEISADVRVIATTQRPLDSLVRHGLFREDLFHTLSILPVHIPPLSQRPEDIPVLADWFRVQHGRKAGLDTSAFSAAALKALQAQAWTGNVRELECTIARAIQRLNRDGILEVEHLFPSQPSLEPSAARAWASEAAPPEDLASIEKGHILAVLERCQGNRTHAAKRLGISIRTLRNKLREYRRESEEEKPAG